jgi:hypothetical protein
MGLSLIMVKYIAGESAEKSGKEIDASEGDA